MLDATVARETGARASDVQAADRPRARRNRPDARRLIAYGALYALCIYLGRLSLQPETGLAFFWPATGIGVLWALACRTRADLVACLSAIAVIASIGNAVSGAAWLAGSVLGLSNVVMALVPRLVLVPPASLPWSRWRLAEWRGLDSVAALGRLLLALTLGAAASGLLGMVGVALAGRDPGWLPWLAWITRNGAAAVVIAMPVLACPVSTGRRGSRRELWSWLWDSRRVELGLLLLVSVVVDWWIFGPGTGLPLTFLAFVLVAWAGLRFPAPLAGLHGSFLALLTLALVQIADGGPIGAITDPGRQAFTLQAFMVLTVVLALLVALVIAERDELATRLAGAMRQARAHAADLETITDTLPEGLVVMRRDGRSMQGNPAAQHLLGEDAGRYFEDLRDVDLRRLDGGAVPPDERPAALALSGQTVRDLRLVSVDGHTGAERVWSFTATPLAGPDGPDRALVLFRDVTDEHERTAQLENFAGVVAHDLQNPVTAIEGWSQVLADALEDLDPAARAAAGRALGHIQRAAGRATQLIGDLLDYSVARTSELHPTEVDLDQLVEQLAESLAAADPARGTCVEHDDLGTVTADPVLMRQLFGNLLGNAVKYTPPGHAPRIQVAAGRAYGRLEVTVTDNGVGIPSAQRSRIFEPFHRAHSDDARFAGTGLGLAICARAVERHGGSLEVTDNPDGPGTRFTVVLPD